MGPLVAIDATMVSPLHYNGAPFSGADKRRGVALKRGRNHKISTYPELVDSSRLRLLTAGIETGGRIDPLALDLFSEAAVARARSGPQVLRSVLSRCFRSRWVVMIPIAAQDDLAATLVNDGVGLLACGDIYVPTPVGLWLDSCSIGDGHADSGQHLDTPSHGWVVELN